MKKIIIYFLTFIVYSIGYTGIYLYVEYPGFHWYHIIFLLMGLIIAVPAMNSIKSDIERILNDNV